MYKLFSIVFIFIGLSVQAQKANRYDSTLKIGKVGYRVTCMNRASNQNVLSIKPIGFKNESREAAMDLKAKVTSAEIDDLNQDGYPDLIIYILEPSGKTNLFCVSSRENESMQPIYFPDITNDSQLSKGYRGQDEYKLVEGILFRKFPVYESDTSIKTPTNKVRQIMYRVVEGDQGSWKFKAFKNFDMNKD